MKPFYKGLLLGLLVKEKVYDLCSFVVFNGINFFHKLRKNVVVDVNIKKCNSITNVYFICQIENINKFNETFPDSKFLPHWDYQKNKNVLKIELDDDFVSKLNTLKNAKRDKIPSCISNEYVIPDIPGSPDISDNNNISFNNLLNLKKSSFEEDEHYITLDIPLFKTFGKLYLYVYYNVDNQNFINVYSDNDIINLDDFNNNEKSKLTKLNSILCSSFKYNNNGIPKIEFITKYLKLFYNNPDTTKLNPYIIMLNYDKINNSLNNSKIIVILEKKMIELDMDDNIEKNI